MGGLSVSVLATARSTGRRVAAVMAAAVMGVGCRQQVFEPVSNALVTTARVQGDVKVITKADLLFVVDDSGSMASKQPKIAAGLPALLAKLEALDPPVDYRLGVMTFSVEERFGPCDETDPTAPQQCSADWGQAGYTCEQNECVRQFPQLAGQLVAAPGNPKVLDRSKLSVAQMEQLFTQNVEVGTQGSQQEQPFRALDIALKSNALSDFLRDDARLVVFLTTDTDDCSDSTDTLMAQEMINGQIVNNCEIQSAMGGPKLDSVGAWVNMFESLPLSSGGKRDVALGAAVGLTPNTLTPGTCTDPVCATNCNGSQGQAQCAQQCSGALDSSLCQSQCIQQCVLWCGSQDPGRRIAQAVNAADGMLSSICNPDFGPSLAKLARVIGIPDAIDLPSTPADPRVFFFTVTRARHDIECQPGRDYTLDLSTLPPEMNIVQTGACRLMPDDHWAITYVVGSS